MIRRIANKISNLFKKKTVEHVEQRSKISAHQRLLDARKNVARIEGEIATMYDEPCLYEIGRYLMLDEMAKALDQANAELAEAEKGIG
jgi:hypothetical protein